MIAVAASIAVAQYVRDNPSQDQSSPSNSSGDRDLAKIDDLVEANNVLKTNDVEFFDSFYEDSININFLVVSVERYIFYRDVYAFEDRLKNLVYLKGENKIREVLSTCFRESALI